MRKLLPFCLLLLLCAGCEMSRAKSVLTDSPWYAESKEAIKEYNAEHKGFLDHGMELWFGKVKEIPRRFGKSGGNLMLDPEKCLFPWKIWHGRGSPFFTGVDFPETIAAGDYIAVIAHRGLKQQLNVRRVVKIANGQLIPFDDGVYNVRETGVNFTNGKSYERTYAKLGSMRFREKYRETDNREYSQYHEKYELQPLNQVRRLKPTYYETFKDDASTQWERLTFPETKFYEILQRYHPPKSEAQEMYQKLLDSETDIAHYLKEREMFYQSKTVK